MNRPRHLRAAVVAVRAVAAVAAVTAVLALPMAALAGGPTAGAATQPGPGSTAVLAPVLKCAPLSGKGLEWDFSIGNKQMGETVCIKVGQTLLVSLTAPVKGPEWHRLQVTPQGVLGRAPLTIMLPRVITASNFRAVKAGTVTISSSRPVCPPATAGKATCMAIEAWEATVVVRRS